MKHPCLKMKNPISKPGYDSAKYDLLLSSNWQSPENGAYLFAPGRPYMYNASYLHVALVAGCRQVPAARNIGVVTGMCSDELREQATQAGSFSGHQVWAVSNTCLSHN